MSEAGHHSGRRSRPPAFLILVAGLAAGVGGLSGCVSTDASRDIDRAQALLAEHAALEADWRTPLDQAAARWDGSTDLAAADAVAVALARSPDLRARVERIAVARADLVQAGLLPNPVLGLALGFPIAGADGGTRIGASLVQDLAALLTIGRRKSAAGAELDRAVIDLSDAAIDLAADVRTRHARAAFAQQAAALVQENADLVRRSLDLTERRRSAGEASRLDANRVRVLLLQAEVEATQLQADADAARRELLAALGMPDAPADWRAVLDPAPPDDLPDEPAVIALASTQRLDVAAAEAVARAAAARAGLARRTRLTHAEAGAEYDREGDGAEFLGPAISLEVPIFDTGDARIAAARAEARAAVHAALAVRQAAVGQARAAWVHAHADAAAAGRFADEIVQLAEDNLDLAQRAYDAGEVDLTGLLDTQRERIRATLEMLRLRERAALSLIELERAAGGSLRP